jgi:hypothetical protein
VDKDTLLKNNPQLNVKHQGSKTVYMTKVNRIGRKRYKKETTDFPILY